MTTQTQPSPATSPGRLADRVAVVTGAASGIGAATARRLARDGARVGLVARRRDRLDALAAELGAAHALSVPADVTDPATIDAAAACIAERLGGVDLVVANAGVMLPAPLAELRVDEWQRMIDVNLVGLLQTVRGFLPALLTAGREGRVADLVIVSSLGARVTFASYAVYGATKAAASYLAQAWRAELAQHGVRVTVVEPGLTQTELDTHVLHPAEAETLARMFERIPPLAADDVADLIAYATAMPRHAGLAGVSVLPARQA
jgi:NADP-dependent 3-hydroxy acid dehydrogenase YdfG